MPEKPATTHKEPTTAFGEFYRAHRTEVLAGGGIAAALLLYVLSKRKKAANQAASPSSSAASSSGIDPSTGLPYSSELAAAQASAAGYNPYSTSPGGYGSGYGDGGTGYSGTSTDAYGQQILAAVTSLQSSLASGVLTSGQTPSVGTPSDPYGPGTSPYVLPSPSTGPTSVPSGPGAAPGGAGRPALQRAATLTAKNLAADRAAAKANPSAKNVAAVKALSSRLNKERAGLR